MNIINQPPGPSGLPIFGILPWLANDPLKTFQKLNSQYGGLVRFKKGQHWRWVLFDPNGVVHILKTNSNKYVKSARYEKMKTFLGSGLVTINGSTWQKHRKAIQPGFSPVRLEQYEEIIKNTCQDFLFKIRKQPMWDLKSLMTQWTLSIISKSTLSTDLSLRNEELSPLFEFGVNFINKRMESFIDWADYFNTPSLVKFNLNQKKLLRLMQELIQSRKISDTPSKDFLTHLLSYQKQNPDSLSDQDIIDELITMIMAGHETSANALTWTLLLLSNNKKEIEKIQSSITNHDYLTDSFKKNQQIENAFNESLRLFPPVWMISRDCQISDELLNYSVTPGQTINICPYVSHRDPIYWDQPNDFLPDRFNKSIYDGTFYPFSLGPRACIGSALANMEAQLILFTLLKNFNFEIENLDLTPQISVVLNPRKKHIIKFTERC